MKKVQKSFLVLVMLVLATISLSLTELKTADPTTGSLTIICHEQKNDDTTTNPPLKGIEYTIYKVDASCQDVDAAETYIEANSVTGITKTTDVNGVDSFVLIDSLIFLMVSTSSFSSTTLLPSKQ